MARKIEYEDLVLKIEPDGAGSYRVGTLKSPYGLALAPFAFPLQRAEVEEILQGVGAGRYRDLATGGPAFEPSRALTEIGARLFRALFQEDLYKIYLRSTARAEAVVDRGLRFCLVLPIGGPNAGLLHDLPWELLYCEERRDFLARNVLTPVVRQLATFGVSSPLPVGGLPRVRILIAVANPRGYDTLDDADERARILQAWCRQQGAEVDLLPKATLRDLHEALRSSHYQVVHFIAHGSFDAETGRGSLALVTHHEGPDLVSSKVLAETLQASRELRLVFLNSCKSARVGSRSGQDPLLGMAAALVSRGIPAVLAMQLAISDGAAKVFSEAVYRSLARGSSLETAVTDGRLALFQAEPESWEWMTPVFFASLSDTVVFRSLCSAVEDRAARYEEAALQAVQLVAKRDYDRAQQVIQTSLDQGAELAELHYLKALALLGGRRPRFLKLPEIRAVEASARRVLDLRDRSAHHLCLVAFLARDFYQANRLVPPPPTYEELLSLASSASLDLSKMTELVSLVSWTSQEVDLIAQRRGVIDNDRPKLDG